ncbi:hypothetical protein BDW74DRAFT_150351 [Aspergillus multicolor]|uniref:uncharacterized protein n=1 Tax=Aspergillus multicolor TaxID=41759 RepID=UPI003CCCF1F9
MSKKSLGRSSGSLNAPIAAFTMAVVLCSYCIYSINSARRGAHGQATGPATAESLPQRRLKQDDWVKRALDEERERKG